MMSWKGDTWEALMNRLVQLGGVPWHHRSQLNSLPKPVPRQIPQQFPELIQSGTY